MVIIHEDETGGHGGDLTAAARAAGLAPGKILDFSSNINPLGPPPGLRRHLAAHLDEIRRYPPPQARELRQALARALNVPPQRLLVGNGANELIHLLFLWLRPRRVLLPAPSFAEYHRAAALVGAAVERFPLPPGAPLEEKALVGKLAHVDLLILCNPNNPTGTFYPGQTLRRVANCARERGTSLLLDESFLYFSGRDGESLRFQEAENLWVVASLTKLWALPGLRLGYLTGPPEAVRRLTRWGDPWRVNSLAQRAGLYCLDRPEHAAGALAVVRKERDYLRSALQKTGRFRVFPSAANFLLVQGLDPGFNATDLHLFLLRHGLLVRRADNFAGLDRRFFRIAVRRRRENRCLLRGIADYLQAVSPRAGESAPAMERGVGE